MGVLSEHQTEINTMAVLLKLQSSVTCAVTGKAAFVVWLSA